MEITALIHSKITVLLLEATHEHHKVTEKQRSPLGSTSLNFTREKTQFHRLQVRHDITTQENITNSITTTLEYTF